MMSQTPEVEQADAATASEKHTEGVEPEVAASDDRDARIEELDRQLSASAEAYGAVLAKYRDALLAASPELPPELVTGATVEELEASVEAARHIVTQVRDRIATVPQGEPRGFPGGAPGRVEPDVSGLSAGEKIRRGLEARARGR